VGYALVTGDGGAFERLSVPVLAYAGPVLAMSGLARLLFGLVPRAAAAAWLALGFVVVVMLFGEVFRMPGWLVDASPFSHLAMVPAEDFRLVPAVVLLGVATVLTATAQRSLSGRDIK
jgi:ABC-2 type transport system permease protein